MGTSSFFFLYSDDLLKGKTTNLLVVLSGRVASATTFNCKDDGPLGVVFDDTVQVGYETKLEDDGLINRSVNFLLQRKEAPWYLEDGTGRVNVVRAHDALGFDNTLKVYVEKSLGEFFESLLSPEEGSKVLYGQALKIGTSMTIVGEAVKDKAGNLMIQESKEQSLMVFSGENSFDKMVGNMKSNSEFYIFYSKIFGTVAVAIAVVYGVDFVRKVLLPFVWKKKDLGNNNRSENDNSDSEDTHQ
ncbi:E3 Ubiquitin ligase GIDE-type [Arabidopsis suecica]|uniref:RING-type E3 ubiquitin transferase n=1 Tax=Arabidopsis suecica TaxID=45249 RepID=A0A8T2CFX7_ARASU|nr:E3 Ubiquitin ligase GIDE-type [Arabidopsis suecica]